MSAQLGLDLGGAPEPQSLFFALWPDALTRARIAALAQALRSDSLVAARHWAAPAKYHATLHHYALAPEAQAAFELAARRAVARLPLRSFVWSPDRIDSFHGRDQHPCILRGAVDPPELRALWEQLREALILEGLGRQLGRQAYTPHITLAYLPRPLAEPRPVEPLQWRVDRLALLHSLPGRPDYERLAEWPLS